MKIITLLTKFILLSLILNFSVLNSEEIEKYHLSDKGTVIDQFGYDSKLIPLNYQKFTEDKYRGMIFDYYYVFSEEKAYKFHNKRLDKYSKLYKEKIINNEVILSSAIIDAIYADLKFLPIAHMLLKYQKTHPEFIKDIIDMMKKWNKVYGKKKIKLINYRTNSYFTEDYYNGFTKKYGIPVDKVMTFYFNTFEKILMDFYNGNNEYLRYHAAKGLFENYNLFYGRDKKRTHKEVEKDYLDILNNEESKRIRTKIKKEIQKEIDIESEKNRSKRKEKKVTPYISTKVKEEYKLSAKGTVIDKSGVDSGLLIKEFETLKKNYFDKMINIGFTNKENDKKKMEAAFNAKLNLEKIDELRAIKSIIGNYIQRELKSIMIFTGTATPLYHLRKGNPPKQPTITKVKSANGAPPPPIPPVIDDRPVYFYDIKIDQIIKGRNYFEYFIGKNTKTIRIEIGYFHEEITTMNFNWGKRKDNLNSFYIQSEFEFSVSSKSGGVKYLPQINYTLPIWKNGLIGNSNKTEISSKDYISRVKKILEINDSKNFYKRNLDLKSGIIKNE